MLVQATRRRLRGDVEFRTCVAYGSVNIVELGIGFSEPYAMYINFVIDKII